MNVKKNVPFFLLLLTILCILCGCRKEEEQILIMKPNANKILVLCENSKDYIAKKELETISVGTKDGEVCYGHFLDKALFNTYKDAAQTLKNITILEEGFTENDNEYIFYKIEDGTYFEYNKIIQIENADVCILLRSTASQTIAKESFDALSFRGL